MSNTDRGESFRAALDLLSRYRTQYERACQEFRWPEAESFNWAIDHFDVIARANDSRALWIKDESGKELARSFEELRVRSNQVANYMERLGVRRGDRVLVMLPNRLELWEIMLAAMKIGAVLCPTTTLLAEDSLRDRLLRGEVRVVVTDGQSVDKFQGLAEQCIRICVDSGCESWNDFDQSKTHPTDYRVLQATREDDPCVLYFTSGTTSKPKMVLHSHRSYPVGHLSTIYWIGLLAGDIHLNISSPGWAKHAWSCFFAPWTVGATVFVYNQVRFNARATLDAMVEAGVTTLCAPPTAWRSIVQENLEDYPVKLRELVSAGEPLNPEVIQRVSAAWGLEIREGYGQTETTALLGNPPGTELRHGSMGRPLPGYQVELRGTDGNPASEGEVSVALRPRPAGVMQGYWGDAAKTERALGSAFFPTGDIASRDEDGYFWFVGRSDDVFKSSDYRISPFELESVLVEHEAVAEAAVVESPDPKRLYVPKACVVLKAGWQRDRAVAKSILAQARQRLAPYQRIRIIEFCDLPKTVSGKIRRTELRATEAERRRGQTRGQHEYFESELFPVTSRAIEPQPAK